MELKIVFLLMTVCVFNLVNLKVLKDEHTLPTDSQELIETYMKRAHEYREHLYWMCTGFDFSGIFEPIFSFYVDYDLWYERCWKFVHDEEYFVEFMRKYRAKLIVEVREEFKWRESIKECQTKNSSNSTIFILYDFCNSLLICINH